MHGQPPPRPFKSIPLPPTLCIRQSDSAAKALRTAIGWQVQADLTLPCQRWSCLGNGGNPAWTGSNRPVPPVMGSQPVSKGTCLWHHSIPCLDLQVPHSSDVHRVWDSTGTPAWRGGLLTRRVSTKVGKSRCICEPRLMGPEALWVCFEATPPVIFCRALRSRPYVPRPHVTQWCPIRW